MKQYFIISEGEQKGPYELAQLAEMNIPRNTKVWTEGYEDWVEAKDIPELVTKLPPPKKNPVDDKKEKVIPPPRRIIKEEKAQINSDKKSTTINTPSVNQKNKWVKIVGFIVLIPIIAFLSVFAYKGFTQPSTDVVLDHKEEVEIETAIVREEEGADSESELPIKKEEIKKVVNNPDKTPNNPVKQPPKSISHKLMEVSMSADKNCIAYADLNKDGIRDCAVLANAHMSKVLMIYNGTKGGDYVLSGNSYNLGANFGADARSPLSIQNRVVSIRDQQMRSDCEIKFRYDSHANKYRLIGSEYNNYGGASNRDFTTVSTNYITGYQKYSYDTKTGKTRLNLSAKYLNDFDNSMVEKICSGSETLNRERDKSFTRKNIRSFISAKVNNYKKDVIGGGISNLGITVKNMSNYKMDEIRVKIHYYTTLGDLYKKEYVYARNIPANGQVFVNAPNSSRGTRVDCAITEIVSQALN